MTTNSTYDVGQMLTDIHLEIYHPLFQNSGFRTISDCTQLNHEKLHTMGILLTGHRKRILKKLQELLEKGHRTPENTTVNTIKNSGDSSLEHNKNLPLLEQNLFKSSVLVDALPGESSTNGTDSLTDYLAIGESVSSQSKHKDMFPEQSKISEYDTALDFREKTDSSFFEFQGSMVENDLYVTTDKDAEHKKQTKKAPTRSFILRNRPVPDLPVSASIASYSRHSGEIMPYTSPKSEITINLENKQSGDESNNPISPYEETFFFNNSKSTKEAAGVSVICSDGTGSSERLLENSQCKSPANATSSGVNSGSEESIYSTLEECAREVGTEPAEDLRSQSLSDGQSQSDTISSHSSESGFQEEFSITPYASFYGPCTMISKVGWLDKLSPHSSCMFQKRWVKFDGHHISYYQNEKDVFSKGKISLSAVIKIQKLGDNKFEVVTSQRTFIFRAEKEALRHDWLTVLEQAIGKQASKSPMASDGEKSGYLELKGYKNEIFTVIVGSKLYLSKSKQEYNAGIAIADITMTMATLKITDRKSFEITTPFRNFCFTADSEREKQDWIETLEQSIAETVADYEVAEKIWFNESNRSCADCRAPNPDWASINLGVVICRSCAGQHKALGSKVSKVHSLKLNTSIWTNELVKLFIVLGNEKVNSFWEENLLAENMLPVTSSINQRRLFVTQKYKEGRFKKILSPDLSPQRLNEALCAAVTKADVLETMTLVFSGADVMCTIGDPVFSTPYLVAKMAGQRLQMEFLHHNRFSDYQTTDYLAKNENNQNLFYCGFLYKASSSSSKLSRGKIKEDMTKWWFTIENGLLSYYKDENTSVPEGCIDLSEAVCLVVHPTDFILDSGAIFTFEIYLLSERMFLFGAENAESQREWAKAISKNFVPTVNDSLVELEFDIISFLYYKDSYTLMEWKEGWFALEKASLHYSHKQEDFQRETVQLKKLQELTKTSSVENGEKRNVLLLVENGRTLYIHGHTVLDFMVWHCAIEKAAGTDGNALQDQQLCKNNIPIIVNSCMAFVTQYGLGSKSLYQKSGNPLKVRELLEDFKKDARSIKLKVGKHQLEDVTDVLKFFVYEIDDALLTKELYPYWISALDIQDEQERVLKYKNLIDTLPALNKTTLAALIEHLYRIQKCSDVNQLDTHVLAKTFSSCLFQTKGHHDEEVCVVEELIKFYAEIFDVSEVQLKQMDIENRLITKWNDAQILVPQSGDLLLDVYLEIKDPDMCVIIRVSSNMIAAELTSCVAGIKNISLSNEMFWTTFEVIEHEELERPMHFKEKILETVLGWSMLPDPGSAYLLVKPFIAIEHLIRFDTNRHIQSGNMKYKEDSSKLLSGNKFQKRYFVLRERKLLIYKDIKSIKPDKVLPLVVCKFYLGVKKKMKPPTRFGLTACFEKHQWHLCCDTQEAQMEWMISILNAQCAGDLLPRSKIEQMLTLKSLQKRGLHENKLNIATTIQPMPMSEKTRRKVRPEISKEGLTSTVQQRMSMMAEMFDSKEERLTNQKKHYSLVDLDSPKNYSSDTKELDTIDVKRLHNPTDQLNKDLSANAQLPQNVIKELNLVLRQNRKDHNECL